jgi:hypothetical protein
MYGCDFSIITCDGKVRILPEELARVAVKKGHSPSLGRASDPSMATALLNGRSPVTSPIDLTPL